MDGPPETALGRRPRTVRRLHPTGESSCGGADQHLPDVSGGVSDAELLRFLRASGYRALTITWVAYDNVKSLATIAALGGHPYHHLTLYEAPIASL